MTALITLCNAGSRALQIAHELHRSESPALTVLNGSRTGGLGRPEQRDHLLLRRRSVGDTGVLDIVMLLLSSLGYWLLLPAL